MNWNGSRGLEGGNCAICGATVREYAARRGWVISKCVSCGFGQTNITCDDVVNFYEADYFGGNTACFSQAGQDEVSESKKWWLNKYVPGDEIKCLEIGPGPAAMVPRYLAETRREFSYAAVEVSRLASDELRRRGYEVCTGKIYDDEITRNLTGRFDYVIATEVIEHDLEPRRFVGGMFNALKPSGRACLTTGNFDGVMARIKRGNWYYLDLPAHVCFYTPRSVRRLFGEAGFRNVHVDCVGFNYIRLYQLLPIPGMLAVVHWLALPTGMTVFAQK